MRQIPWGSEIVCGATRVPAHGLQVVALRDTGPPHGPRLVEQPRADEAVLHVVSAGQKLAYAPRGASRRRRAVEAHAHERHGSLRSTPTATSPRRAPSERTSTLMPPVSRKLNWSMGLPRSRAPGRAARGGRRNSGGRPLVRERAVVRGPDEHVVLRHVEDASAGPSTPVASHVMSLGEVAAGHRVQREAAFRPSRRRCDRCAWRGDALKLAPSTASIGASPGSSRAGRRTG